MWKLFKGGNYSQKYGTFSRDFLAILNKCLYKNDRKKRVFFTEMQMRIHKFFEPIAIFWLTRASRLPKNFLMELTFVLLNLIPQLIFHSEVTIPMAIIK